MKRKKEGRREKEKKRGNKGWKEWGVRLSRFPSRLFSFILLTSSFIPFIIMLLVTFYITMLPPSSLLTAN